MIEYLLIFVLGFAAALLFALIVAPAVHRRVVTLTERRMRATVALTTNEIRAEQDGQRVRQAMENRRLAVELKDERERRGIAVAQKDQLIGDLTKAYENHSELGRRIDDLAEEGRSLRDRLREEEERSAAQQASLAGAERLGESRYREIGTLSDRIKTLSGSLDEYKIEVATRDTSIENLNYQIAQMRDERKTMREEVRAASAEANEMRARVEREETRASSLETKLSASIAELSDREGELERANGKMQRLREKLAEAMQETAVAAAALASSQSRCEALETEIARLEASFVPDEAGLAATQTGTSRILPAEKGNGAEFDHNGRMTTMAEENNIKSPAIAKRVDRLRKRHAALVADLKNAPDGQDDTYVREEIAEIAAMMVDLTVEREGPASPIRAILDADKTIRRESGRLNLAERSRRLIEAPSVSTDQD